MKLRSLIASTGLLITLVIWPTTASNASTSSGVSFSVATLTATSSTGESALNVTITNNTNLPISLSSVTSPAARMGMIYYDANMCQGHNGMVWLPDLFIVAHSVQHLGYQYQGAMLAHLRHSLALHQHVNVRFTWTSFTSQIQVKSISALVIAPPHGLHFDLTIMKM